MRGYLGESPTGRMQTFYVSPDGNHVVAGLLFRNGGVNVTGVQIGEMQSRFEKAMEESAASTGAGDLGGDRKSTRLTPVTNAHLVCRLLLAKKKIPKINNNTQYIHKARTSNNHRTES